MNELKLWNCMKWECVQTLLFSCPNPSSLRMDMNITANFFVLADSQRKVSNLEEKNIKIERSLKLAYL